MKKPLFIKSVGKIFRLVELLAESNDEYTLSEIKRKLDISMGAAQRLTNTLVTLNYLYKEPKTKNYHLTPKLFQFGFAFLSRSEIRKIAFPYLRQLNEDLDEVVNLGVMINDEEIVLIDRIDKTSRAMITNLRVGSRAPIYISSIGKAILALLPESDQGRILKQLYSPKYKGKIPFNEGQLLNQLQEVRLNGYSLNESDLFPDVFSVAAPILNYDRLPVAAINLVIPRKFSRRRLKKINIPMLIEIAKKISMELGNLS